MKSLLITGSILASLFALGACTPKASEKAPVIDKQIAAAKTANQGPALWLVKDADTNIYLFGTVHILKPGTKWQTDKFNSAFAKSDAIYQEADLSAEVQRKLAPLIPSLGLYSDGRTLLEVLDADDEREVLETAAIVGMPPEALARMKPWMAAIGLTQMHMVKEGYEAESGVEQIITAKAKNDDKPLRFLETAQQQLHFMADLPEASQIEFLVSGAMAIEDTPEMLDELVEDWAKGDVVGIAEIMSDEDVLGDRTVYNTLLVNRNQVWARKIKKLMDDEAGTFMITVGAAHLAGNDSVIVLLRDEGETVTRQ